MLKIIIRNVTFECQYAGQIIEVALLKDEWLHEGRRCKNRCTLEILFFYLFYFTAPPQKMSYNRSQ